MTSQVKRSTNRWTNIRYKGHVMEILKGKKGYVIKHTYPNHRKGGILSMPDKPRWYLIDLLLNCGWRLTKEADGQ